MLIVIGPLVVLASFMFGHLFDKPAPVYWERVQGTVTVSEPHKMSDGSVVFKERTYQLCPFPLVAYKKTDGSARECR